MTQFGYDGHVGCAAVTFKAGASPDRADSVELESVRDLERWLSSKAGLATYGIPRFLRVLVDVGEDEPAERDQLGISDSVGSERVSDEEEAEDGSPERRFVPFCLRSSPKRFALDFSADT